MSTRRLILVMAAAAAAVLTLFLALATASGRYPWCGSALAPASGINCDDVLLSRRITVAGSALVTGVLGFLAYRTHP
jgi:hypothetical protein